VFVVADPQVQVPDPVHQLGPDAAVLVQDVVLQKFGDSAERPRIVRSWNEEIPDFLGPYLQPRTTRHVTQSRTKSGPHAVNHVLLNTFLTTYYHSSMLAESRDICCRLCRFLGWRRSSRGNSGGRNPPSSASPDTPSSPGARAVRILFCSCSTLRDSPTLGFLTKGELLPGRVQSKLHKPYESKWLTFLSFKS
jgi:hypothetical protein